MGVNSTFSRSWVSLALVDSFEVEPAFSRGRGHCIIAFLGQLMRSFLVSPLEHDEPCVDPSLSALASKEAALSQETACYHHVSPIDRLWEALNYGFSTTLQ